MRHTFYRRPNWAVVVEGYLSLLSCLLILIKLSSASSVFQSVMTIDPLMCGIWAMMIGSIAINNWAARSIPADCVSKTEGGTL